MTRHQIWQDPTYTYPNTDGAKSGNGPGLRLARFSFEGFGADPPLAKQSLSPMRKLFFRKW
jgi:hypothetical protein